MVDKDGNPGLVTRDDRDSSPYKVFWYGEEKRADTRYKSYYNYTEKDVTTFKLPADTNPKIDPSVSSVAFTDRDGNTNTFSTKDGKLIYQPQQGRELETSELRYDATTKELGLTFNSEQYDGPGRKMTLQGVMTLQDDSAEIERVLAHLAKLAEDVGTPHNINLDFLEHYESTHSEAIDQIKAGERHWDWDCKRGWFLDKPLEPEHFKLTLSEFISQINWRDGERLGLQFVTNTGRASDWYGSEEGELQEPFKADAHSEICGINGRQKAGTMDRNAELSARFKLIDTNNNGKLKMSELAAVFGEHAEEFVKVCNASEMDGELTCDEFCNGILGYTAEMSNNNFQTNWLDRMVTSIYSAKHYCSAKPSAPNITATTKELGLTFNSEQVLASAKFSAAVQPRLCCVFMDCGDKTLVKSFPELLTAMRIMHNAFQKEEKVLVLADQGMNHGSTIMAAFLIAMLRVRTEEVHMGLSTLLNDEPLFNVATMQRFEASLQSTTLQAPSLSSDNALRMLRTLFEEADVDNSGSIDTHELTLLFKNYYSMQCSHRSYCTVKLEVEAAMLMFDRDKNGGLSFDEFVAFYTSEVCRFSGAQDLTGMACSELLDKARKIALVPAGAGCKIPDTAYRAISLGQLERIEKWTKQQIEDHSVEWYSKMPVTENGQQKFGDVRITENDTVTLYDLNALVILPCTKEQKCSMVELLATGPQKPDFFVSHWW